MQAKERSDSQHISGNNSMILIEGRRPARSTSYRFFQAEKPETGENGIDDANVAGIVLLTRLYAGVRPKGLQISSSQLALLKI